MRECRFCEKETDVLFPRKYLYEEGIYCEGCINKLDKYTERDWKQFYGELSESGPYDYPSIPRNLESQSQDPYGICDYCGKNRKYGNCTCV